MSHRGLIAASICAIALAAACTPAQMAQEPVGWPRRAELDPEPAAPAASSREDGAPDRPSAAGAEPETPQEAPQEAPLGRPLDAAPEPVARRADPAADIGALDRFDLPITPLDFVFRDGRIDLTRKETQALDRLAIRLRGRSDAVRITATGPPGPDAPAALEAALARALAVRRYLLQQGVRAAQLETVAELADTPATATLTIRPAVSALSAEDGRK